MPANRVAAELHAHLRQQARESELAVQRAEQPAPQPQPEPFVCAPDDAGDPREGVEEVVVAFCIGALAGAVVTALFAMALT